jgi:hypothetical protein
MSNEDSWEEIYKTKFSDSATPPHWPRTIRGISIHGLALFGLDPANGEVYWDGQKIQTVKVLGKFERLLATLVTVSTIVLALIECARFAAEQNWL